MRIDFDDILTAVRPDPTWSIRLDVDTGSVTGLPLVEALGRAVEIANDAHGDPSDMHDDTWAESVQLSNDGASLVMVGWKDWCVRCAGWASAVGGTGYLGRIAYNQVAPDTGVGAMLHASVLGAPVASFASVSYAGSATGARHVTVGADGLTVGQSWDPAGTTLDAARDLLIALADIARVGFVAMISGWAHLWDSRRHARPPLPTMKAGHLRRQPELWDQYVPDAHVLQLLTQRHLDLVADLSAWQVTEVIPGRFLVAATDPGPWLRDGGPDETTVVRARANFGRAIISSQDPQSGR